MSILDNFFKFNKPKLVSVPEPVVTKTVPIIDPNKYYYLHYKVLRANHDDNLKFMGAFRVIYFKPGFIDYREIDREPVTIICYDVRVKPTPNDDGLYYFSSEYAYDVKKYNTLEQVVAVHFADVL
jgi:hypothetical protein